MKNRLLITLFGLVIFMPAYAQEELPLRIQNYFDTLQNEYPVEKAYLHLDRSTYTLGEVLWFSAYLTAGAEQVPSPLSTTLYVDLFDGDGLLLDKKIVRIEKGRGKGDFTLPAYGKPGLYQLKAYTSWMRNFGEDYFFHSQLNVIDGAGGSFLPNITFNSIAASAGQVTYKANLLVADSGGNPLGGKTIQIKAKSGEEELYSMALPLNAQGELNFTFSIPEKPNPTQHLELTFMENDNYAVTQKVSLPYSLTLADIQFLPEGGHAVIGKKTNFGFRAVYPDGNPADISGYISGSETTFESNIAGLGKFELTPTEKSYQAKIVEKTTGQEITATLPKIDEEGLVMQVANIPAAKYISVFVQGSNQADSLLLVSHTRGLINYMIKGGLTNGVWGVRIPKENLISGINQITVLTADGKPLLERLVFINNDDQLTIDITKTGSIAQREKIKLDISTSFSGVATPGTYSIAVLDAGQIDANNYTSGNILSSLMLTSDLAGGVYQAERYFRDNSADTQMELDYVMLTHGWRRFSWDDVVSSTYPEITNFIEQGITIEGQVTDSGDTRKGLTGGKITALIEGSEIITSEFGPSGRFIFRDLNYLDSARVTITAEDKRLTNFVDVSILFPEPVFSSTLGKYSDSPLWSEELTANYAARARISQLTNEEEKLIDLGEVTVESTTIADEDTKIRKIYGDGDVSINPEKISAAVSLNNVFELIQGRVAGVQVSVSGQDVRVTIRGVGTLGGASSEPLYLLNNIPVQAAVLLSINPRDVESIDVFKDPASTTIFGSQGANGVIAVYSKTGVLSNVSIRGTLVTSYKGYSVPREFYLPKYLSKTPENAATDVRATIYWNPLLEIGENGKISLEYYNTDLAKKHLVIIEGINASGKLGHIYQTIE
jgi:TonB-dependent SusC/RagA subfamily outer membrane receptor